MTRFEIYPESEVKDVVRLKLVEGYEGDTVSLVAVDRNGKVMAGGYLLTIDNKGRVSRHYSVNVPGLPDRLTDADGK